MARKYRKAAATRHGGINENCKVSCAENGASENIRQSSAQNGSAKQSGGENRRMLPCCGGHRQSVKRGYIAYPLASQPVMAKYQPAGGWRKYGLLRLRGVAGASAALAIIGSSAAAASAATAAGVTVYSAKKMLRFEASRGSWRCAVSRPGSCRTVNSFAGVRRAHG